MELSEQERFQVPVSIIVPVYNVYEWLDPCMESVTGQTFSDFEVILVDDGSTDGSGEKCDWWAGKDRRVRVIHKENEGPSKARNLAMREAAGDYLVFLDADDWIDKSYLEIMYHRITETDADMAECDVYRVNSETGTKTYRVCHGVMGRSYTLEEHMKYGYTAIWKCMIKKELFTRYNIEFPDCHSEARAIYALLLAVSRKVENVHKALYYYRIFRKGSLTAKPTPRHEQENEIGILASEYLLQGFERCGLYGKYEKLLQEIVKLKLSDLLASFFYRREKEDFQLLTENYRAYLVRRFTGGPDYRYMTWGGYNLNRILCNMNVLHDPYCRFNFSSLVSLMHPVRDNISCSHKNRYREMMLEREIHNQFWDILEEMKPEYIFMDFIEERFDLIAFGEGYLTKSDAFDGAQCMTGKSDDFDRAQCMIEKSRVVPRKSEECRRLWEESCSQFVKKLQKEYPSVRIVLIKNYLSEKVGDIYQQKEYENIKEIREINRILEGYYRYFENQLAEVKAVEASECSYYFTDHQYEYGAIPSHLNELANQEIARMIERSIEA